jgi:serine/threonine protein kinase/Tfp pilus assembly protein PilF
MVSADRLIEVFDEAKALPAGAERERFLTERCKDEQELKEQVVSLLQAPDGAGDFLRTSPVAPTGLVTEQVGDKIGRYKLLQKIGEGGMGTVFMAEQTEPLQRKVALKVIKAGMDSRQVIARFEAERQALAMMDHINIARVLDAGATESGRPYFVMELVHGVPITKYCDDNHLTPRERLELFVPICQAIQHAHQKGIIHRDIKPSNVMITLYDGKPVPKVIDFGVAKATEQKLTERTLFTQYGTMVGTLEYMSPEQAEMSALGVDTRSDIYSLGVLLYELLTGSTPLSLKRLREAAYGEILRMIKEEEPPKPSTRLSNSGEALASISAQRHMEPAKLTKLVRGELDWIVMKTLEKDRNRRYETANDVALDLQHYLKSEPVLACPPSAAYRFRKFARRNKAALATALALVLAVLLAVVGLIVNNRLVTAEKERADQNLSRAREAVKQYLLKTSENPLLSSGDFQGLRKELLETAIPFYEEFVRQDQQNPDLEFERGRAYDDLGFLRQGIGDLEQAVADYAEAQGIFRRLATSFPEKPAYRLRLAEGYNSRGGVLDDLGRLEAAEGEYRQALTLAEQLQSGHDAASESLESLARIQGNLGLLLKETGRLREAESMLRQAVATREKLLEQKPNSLPLRGQLAWSWNNLGTLLRAGRQSAEAESAFERVLKILDPEAMQQITSGSPEPGKFQQQRAQAWNNLGTTRIDAGRFADAEQAFRQALAIKEKLAATFPSIPKYRQDLAASFNNLGTVLASLKRLDDAQAAYHKAIQLYERLAADSPAGTPYAVELAGTYANLGRLMGDQGQLEQSLPWLTKGVEILEGALRRDQRVVKVRETLCVAYWARAMTQAGLGRFSKGVEDWDRAIEMDDGRYRIALLLKRASNLLNLKDHVRATADAAAIAESSAATAEDLYNAACVYALSAQMIPDDAPRADADARHAVQLLRQAAAKGFKDAAHVKTDSDLDSLRSRKDFQHFIEELGAGSSKL